MHSVTPLLGLGTALTRRRNSRQESVQTVGRQSDSAGLGHRNQLAEDIDESLPAFLFECGILGLANVDVVQNRFDAGLAQDLDRA